MKQLITLFCIAGSLSTLVGCSSSSRNGEVNSYLSQGGLPMHQEQKIQQSQGKHVRATQTARNESGNDNAASPASDSHQ